MSTTVTDSETTSELTERKRREKEFHDRLRTVDADAHVADTRWSSEMEETIRTNPLWANMKYYAIERRSREMVLNWFRQNTPGKLVLDLCCGNGADGIFIAQQGAKQVFGVDLSEVSIRNCQKHATEAGVADRVTHEVGDAEHTRFPANSFDVITEYGALHHVDLDKTFAEMVRILRPDGKVICQEALGHNFVIHAYRKLTPHLRTEWEADHILRRKDFEVARKYFGRVEIRFFHLASLFAVPFRKTVLFRPMLVMLEKIDALLLRVPGIRWQAWQAVFTLSEPRKTNS